MRLLVLLLAALPLAAQVSGYKVVLTWIANPANTGTVAYNVYRGPCAPTTVAPVKLNSTPITGVTFTDTAPPYGTTICYTATAVANGVESLPSLPDVAVLPPVTQPPTGLSHTIQQALAMLLKGIEMVQALEAGATLTPAGAQ